MIRADEMPYRVGMPYRDGEPIVYDSGDYPARSKRRSTRSAGSRRSAGVSARRAGEGRYLGLGIGCYIEGTGVGPFESAFVRIDPTGKIYVSCGAAPQGQGMETIFAQIVADLWKVAPEDVVVVARRHRGDRDRLRHDGEPQHGHRCRRRCTTPASGCARRCSRSPPTSSNARRPISNCATAGSASSGCRATHGEPCQAGAGRAPGLGATGARRGSRPGSRRPITGSRRPSPGAMPCMSRSSRSTARPAGSGSRNTRSRMIAASSSTRCWSRARSWAARCRGWAASSARRSPTMPTGSC